VTGKAHGDASPDVARVAAVKQCCARLYESEWVTRLLGESLHPGGVALTERLGDILGLTSTSRVLDVASGRGTSAIVLAQRFGCSVVGVDLSAQNVERATAEAHPVGLADRVRFQVGDAERLPIESASMDALVCECAFCTFPDKPAAAREFARVLRPGGSVGLSDITRAPGPPGEFDDLMAWVACLADARTADVYVAWLTAEGFTGGRVERHDHALTEMVRSMGQTLFTAELLAGLKQIELEGIDLAAAKRLTKQALTAVTEGRLGYAVMTATMS
jgi:arsenite methyltransferase